MYRELLAEPAHHWIDAESFRAGVLHVCWHHQSDYLPPPAVFIQACRNARDEATRKGDNERLLAALPAPNVTTPPSAYPREKWDRNVAIGKARIRKRKVLIQQYRTDNKMPKHAGVPESCWKGLDHPTEDEIDAVLRQMAAGKELKGTLEAALAVRVPIDAGVDGEPVSQQQTADGPTWPGAKERGA